MHVRTGVKHAEQTQGATNFHAPAGFTVVAARELFNNQFGDEHAEQFFEFECELIHPCFRFLINHSSSAPVWVAVMKENSVTGAQVQAR
jgi:hypothetical protein